MAGVGTAVPQSDGDNAPLGPSGDEANPGGEPGPSTVSAAELAAFRQFQKFMQMEPESRVSPRRPRRRAIEDIDDDEENDGKGGASGPPPSWDGVSEFEDYLIRARLWLATTKTKAKARGPLLLKALSSAPFETFKYLAKDTSWLSDSQNAERFLQLMNQPEYFGNDRQEHLITSLSRVTYHLKRSKAETWREFFARWEGAMRKVTEHKVELPDEYQGFLIINGLQLSEMETKNLLNFTRGDIRPKSIKEWLRKNETRLSASELGADKDKTKRAFGAHHLEDPEIFPEDQEEQDIEDEINELEAYMTSFQDDIQDDPDQILEAHEAQEILATMLHQRKTYKESLLNKKSRELSRGYLPKIAAGSKGQGKGNYKNFGPVRPANTGFDIAEPLDRYFSILLLLQTDQTYIDFYLGDEP